MKKIIMDMINETIQSGTGQMIIAFSSWIYAIVLFLITIYYFIIALIKKLIYDGE
jgi:hypothetical protein